MEGIKFLAGHCVEEDTNKQGRLAWRRWEEYCRKVKYKKEGEPRGVVATIHLCGYIWELFKIKTILAWETYKGQMNGLRREMGKRFIDTKGWDSDEVLMVKNGLRKAIGKYELHGGSNYRGSLTPGMFKEILLVWDNGTVESRNARRLVTVCLAKAMRMGELAKTSHNKGRVPKLKHVTEKEEGYALTVKMKQDKWYKGTVVSVKEDKKNKHICGVEAIKECLEESHCDGEEEKILFCDREGQALTTAYVIGKLHEALNKSKISTQGKTTKVCRRGRVQEEKDAGASGKEIRKLGRWATDCWKVYAEKDDRSKKSRKAECRAMLKSIIYLVEGC